MKDVAKVKKQNAGVTLQMWRFFVHAVEQGSLSKAAELCNVDVAFISREIRKLELFMGEALLVRTKRGVKPTWPGVQRYRIAVDVVKEFDALSSGFLHPKNVERNTVRIAVPVSLSSLFVKWVTGFKNSAGNQNLHIDLVEYSGEPLQDITRFDIFICEDELPRSRVLAEQLGYVQRGIVVSSDFLKGEPELKIPEDLIGRYLIAEKSERILMLARESCGDSNRETGKYYQSIALPIEPTLKVNNSAALAESVLTGIGYAIGVPIWQVAEQLKSGELVQVLTNWRIAARPVWLMRQSSSRGDIRLKSLCRYFCESWGQTQGLYVASQINRIITDVH